MSILCVEGSCGVCSHFVIDACLRCQTDGKQEECVGKNPFLGSRVELLATL